MKIWVDEFDALGIESVEIQSDGHLSQESIDQLNFEMSRVDESMQLMGIDLSDVINKFGLKVYISSRDDSAIDTRISKINELYDGDLNSVFQFLRMSQSDIDRYFSIMYDESDMTQSERDDILDDMLQNAIVSRFGESLTRGFTLSLEGKWVRARSHSIRVIDGRTLEGSNLIELDFEVNLSDRSTSTRDDGFGVYYAMIDSQLFEVEYPSYRNLEIFDEVTQNGHSLYDLVEDQSALDELIEFYRLLKINPDRIPWSMSHVDETVIIDIEKKSTFNFKIVE